MRHKSTSTDKRRKLFYGRCNFPGEFFPARTRFLGEGVENGTWEITHNSAAGRVRHPALLADGLIRVCYTFDNLASRGGIEHVLA